jgi:3-oxoacyl-[acyl-carrier protein] reductase
MTSDRIALVTGGSRGIGAACVRRLAQDGFDVTFNYRGSENAANELAKELADLGVRASAVKVDVADAAQVADWVARTEKEFGPINAVVTSAGITADAPMVTMSHEKWHEVLRINLDGVFNVCKAVAFPMMKRKKGSITTISSVSGVYGNAGQTNYAASKAGIIGFTKSLAKEAGRSGLRANVVAPGLIETEMTSVMPDAARKKMLDMVAMRRMGTADEVADLVAYLSSDKASYITGAVVEVHGGFGV